MKKDYFLLEKKELIVLILLLTLVGLVAFTIGIKMGKSLRDEEIKIADAHKPVQLPAMEADLEKHSEHDSKDASMTPSAIMEDKLVKAVEGDNLPSSKALEENAKKHDKMQTTLPEEKAKKSAKEKTENHSEVKEPKEAKSSEHGKVSSEHGKNKAEHGEKVSSPISSKVKQPVINPKDNTGKITIQVGSYTSAEEAKTHVDNLVRDGLAAFYYPISVSGLQYYRVCVGVFERRVDAQNYVKANKSLKNSIVRTIDN